MMQRRRVCTGLMAWGLVPSSQAAQRASLAHPLRMGVEHALFAGGLAPAWQRAFGRDTGVAVELVPGPSASLLNALERGELDATLTNAPGLELQLERQGLAHDRRQLAVSDFMLVGPGQAPKASKAASNARRAPVAPASTDPAGVQGWRNVVTAMARLAEGQHPFVSSGLGTGAHLMEQALWQAAKVQPAAAWQRSAANTDQALQQASTQGAYALVERAVWLDGSRSGLAVMVEGDERLACEVHVMRSFRVNHPAAKLFTQWLQGPAARRTTAQCRGWQAPVR